IDDQTLSFQLHEGFHVLAVVPHYLSDDPDSLGYAALIEWLNPLLAEPHHTTDRPTQFLHKDVLTPPKSAGRPRSRARPTKRTGGPAVGGAPGSRRRSRGPG